MPRARAPWRSTAASTAAALTTGARCAEPASLLRYSRASWRWRTSTPAHALGLINPAIYQIEARHERGIVDITKGNNSQTFTQDGRRYTVNGFSARRGYDLVTGVGTVDAPYFVPELAAG